MKDDVVAETVAQKNFLSMHDFASENEHNVYFTPPDLSLHPLHPLRQQLRSRKKALAYDMDQGLPAWILSSGQKNTDVF